MDVFQTPSQYEQMISGRDAFGIISKFWPTLLVLRKEFLLVLTTRGTLLALVSFNSQSLQLHPLYSSLEEIKSNKVPRYRHMVEFSSDEHGSRFKLNLVSIRWDNILINKTWIYHCELIH